MATQETYPVPAWVRTVVCLTPFVIAGASIIISLLTDRGFLLVSSCLTLCGAIANKVLTRS
jgi:hypothetical protein